MTAASSSDTTAPASNARDSTWQKGNLSFLSDVFQATTEKHSATNTKKKPNCFYDVVHFWWDYGQLVGHYSDP